MNRAKSICAVAIVLIFFALVLGVTEGTNGDYQPTVSFTTDSTALEATHPFDVTLKVVIDPSIVTYASVWGDFSVRDLSGSIVDGPEAWVIDFDGPNRELWLTEGEWTFRGVVVSSAGDYYLWTDVHWEESSGWHTAPYTQTIYVAPAPVEYYIEWLKPISLGKPFKAGSTIKIKFSVFDSPTNGKFVHDDTVKVTYSKTGTESEFELSPVRIKDNTECYIVYWKTERGMSGDYTITVTFANAQATPPAIITIRP